MCPALDTLLKAGGMNLPSRLHGMCPRAFAGDQNPQRSLTLSVKEAIKKYRVLFGMGGMVQNEKPHWSSGLILESHDIFVMPTCTTRSV